MRHTAKAGVCTETHKRSHKAVRGLSLRFERSNMLDWNFTKPLLLDYRKAALSNASSLLSESRLLLDHKHFARSYFLSVAAIEEVGKSAILYQALGRNLKASDVQSRIRIDIQSHSTKITSAFVASLKSLDEQQLRESLSKILGYAIDLKRGREPAMYSDVGSDLCVKLPQSSVRPPAAEDCLRLAIACFDSTKLMIDAEPAPRTTPEQDKMWTLGKKAHQVWKEEDFGEFLLDYIQRNGANGDVISPAVTTYYDDFLSQGHKFKP